MGHCEGASGLAAIVKIMLSYYYGTIPPNIHFNEPNGSSEGLVSGLLKVVTEPTPWNGGVTALNNFGFGGSNVHVLMDGKPGAGTSELASSEEADDQNAVATYSSGIVPLFSRTKAGLQALVKAYEKLPADRSPYQLPLLSIANDLTENQARHALHRATIIGTQVDMDAAANSNLPVWFVFTGNGSQWTGMARDLLESNAIFKAAITSCCEVASKVGIDLMSEFLSDSGWTDALKKTVGLTAVQIGLVDVLKKEFGLEPAGMFGHSAGEIACGYADGCMSLEQTLLVSYHRGRIAPENGVTNGLMASVGLSAEEAEKRVAGMRTVAVACDNAPQNVTLSGDADELRPLLDKLKAEGAFVREVDSSGIPYHSPQVAALADKLQAALQAVIPSPKKRSPKWISTSFAPDDESEAATTASAEYQVQSYSNRVLFCAACKAIPEKALVLEIGPHSLMRALLKQSRPDIPYVPAMVKGLKATETVPAAVAALWRKGGDVKFYAEKEVVRPGCKVLKNAKELPLYLREALVSWDHAVDYVLPTYTDYLLQASGTAYEKTFDLGGKEAYIADHVVDGRILVPATAYMVTAWEALAASMQKEINDLEVVITNAIIHRAVPCEADDKVTLGVLLDKANRFQVIKGDELVAEGTIKVVAERKPPAEGEEPLPVAEDEPWSFSDMESIDSGSVYRHMVRYNRLMYGPHFQVVEQASINGDSALLRWDDNWITFLDSMLQVFVGAASGKTIPKHEVRVPVRIREMHLNKITPPSSGAKVITHIDGYIGSNVNSLATIAGMETSAIPAKESTTKANTVVEEWVFWPYGDTSDTDCSREEYVRCLYGYLKQLLSTGFEKTEREMPPHFAKLKKLLPLLKEPSPDDSTLQRLMDKPEHIFLRMMRDLLGSQEAFDATMESPLRSIVTHPEHPDMYLLDPFCGMVGPQVFKWYLDIVMENCGNVFKVMEVGAGTGGLTKQAFPMLNTGLLTGMISYTATDLLAGVGHNLKDAINSKKFLFQPWDVNQPPPEALGGPFDLVLANNALHTANDIKNALVNVAATLRDGGFLCIYEVTGPVTGLFWGLDENTWNFEDERDFGLWISQKQWEERLEAAGFQLVCKHSCPIASSCLMLARKKETPKLIEPEEGGEPVPKQPAEPVLLIAPDTEQSPEEDTQWLEQFQTTLKAAEERGEDCRMWVAGAYPQHAGLVSLIKSARREPGGDRLRGFFKFDPSHSSASGMNGSTPSLSLEGISDKIKAADFVLNVMLDGKWGSYRFRPLPDTSKRTEESTRFGVHLTITKPGDLSTLCFVPRRAVQNLSEIVECHVAYGALNFRDVMLAYGKLPPDAVKKGATGNIVGFEFSGLVKAAGGATTRRIMGAGPAAVATRCYVGHHVVWDVPEKWDLAQAATVPVAYATSYYALVARARMRKGHKVLIHSGSGAVGLAAIQIALSRGAEVFTTVGSSTKKSFLMERFGALGLREDHIGDSHSTSFEQLVMHATGGAGVDLVLNSLAEDKLMASFRCLAQHGHFLEIGKYDLSKNSQLGLKPFLNNITFHGVDLDQIMHSPNPEWSEVHDLVSEGIKKGEVVPLPTTVFPMPEVEDAFRYMAKGTHIGKVLIQIKDKAVIPNGHSTTEAPENAPALDVVRRLLSIPSAFSARPDRSYILTGGLGGFGLALAHWLAETGAVHIILTSRSGARKGAQRQILEQLAARGAKVEVSKLDVGDLEQTKKLIALAESKAPLGGIFHMAMVLQDALISKQTGETWRNCMQCKAVGAFNLHKATLNNKTLEQFVMFSSVSSAIGNPGQTNYAYANGAMEMLVQERKRAGLPAMCIQWGYIDNVGFWAEFGQGEIIFQAQPIDECMMVMGHLMSDLQPNVVTVYVKKEQFKEGTSTLGKNLVKAVLGVLGLEEGNVKDVDTLAVLGIDSMQMVEVQAMLQKATGMPFALAQVGSITVAALKDIQSQVGGGDSAPAAAAGDSAPPAAAAEEPKEAPAPPPKKETPPPAPKKDPAPAAAATVAAAAATAAVVPAVAARSAPAVTAKSVSESAPAAPVVTAVADNIVVAAPSVAPVPVPMPLAPKASEPEPTTSTTVTSLPSIVIDESTDELQYKVLSTLGVLYIGMVITLVGTPFFSFAYTLASTVGILIALPFIPALWLLWGASMCLATALTRRIFMPHAAPNYQIKQFSPSYVRWWTAVRMTHVTNMFFADYLQGSVFLVWYYRILGAQLGSNVTINTTDITDPELLSAANDVVIDEGATVMGHALKDGLLSFNFVVLGQGAMVMPYAVVLPGTRVADKAVVPTLKSTAQTGPQTAPKGVKDLSLSPEESPLTTTDLVKYQAVALYALGLLSTLCSVAVFFVMCGGAGSGAAAVAALVTLCTYTYLPLLPVMLPSSVTASSLLITALKNYFVVGGPLLFAVAFVLYGALLTVAASLAKRKLVGVVQPGLYPAHCLSAFKLWASKRLVQLLHHHFYVTMTGTYGVNWVLAALGARIGKRVIFRYNHAHTVPDMLEFDEDVSMGDVSSTVASVFITPNSVYVDKIKVGKGSMVGMGSVLLAGSSVAADSTLGLLSCTAVGQQLSDPAMMYMGAPAQVVMKLTSEITAPASSIDMLHKGWALAQPLITAFGLALSAYPALIILPALSALGLPSFITGALALLVTGTAMCAVIILVKMSVSGVVQPGSYPMLSQTTLSRTLTLVQHIVFCFTYGEMVRGSWLHNLYMNFKGTKVDWSAYVDTWFFADDDLATFGPRSVVSRHALVYCHLMYPKNKKLKREVENKKSTFGADSTVGVRAACIPGFSLPAGKAVEMLGVGMPGGSL